jgi:diguanylate cyclase (GGDEF)-like protein
MPLAVAVLGAESGERRLIWELGDPAVVFAPDDLCEEVERWFARNPESSSAVLRDEDGRLEILTRQRVALELAGRLGHGRSLYGRRPIRFLPGSDETLILDGSTSLVDAGKRSLARRPGHRHDDFIVTHPSGSISTVSVARLFGQLANAHAHRAVHDRLTGLPNRELFVERLRDVHGSTAALFIDLDDFKAVNDTLGHSAGDELLTVVAQRLQSAAIEGELVARLSGDEFGVLQPGGNEATARDAAARIERALAVPATLFGRSLIVGASIGIAVAEEGGEIALLLRNADIAMYESKRSGKRRATVYRPEMFRQLSRRLELKTDIDAALRQGELRLVYQPIVSLSNREVTTLEALLRWRHPRLGEISPLDFITLAEESGAIVDIGRWVIEEAAAQARRLGDELGRTLKVTVNVSARQLERREFADEVRAAVDMAGLAPEQLVLEITETAVAADDVALEVIHELAEDGIGFAIDDFGTGFSSLERLDRLPIVMLKIDRSFVARMDDGKETRLLNGLRSLAQAMGIETVVEGIETAQQLHTLTELGYTSGQGFHLSRPLETDALRAQLPAVGLDDDVRV